MIHKKQSHAVYSATFTCIKGPYMTNMKQFKQEHYR